MRNFILASLKEVVGRWADPYTSGVFQYNSDFYTLYGQPEGYGSVQNLNDKHFHWSYFLRAAATIGRYDKAWLESYLPLFTEMIGDVASYDRSSTRYPFLRNFSPFYGHHWANGTANGGLGNDQESTSEAINFSVGMLELGEILGKSEWRDLGMYFYEEEILAVDQYWFNQDADLTKSSGTYWNGNWPDSFVHYQHNGVPFTTPFIGQLFQTYATRSTYFGSAGSPPFATSLLIQAVPLSASHLYLGRNQTWLQQAWAQYGREAALDPRQTAYEVVLAGVQARLPLTGTLANATPNTPEPVRRAGAHRPPAHPLPAPQFDGRELCLRVGRVGSGRHRRGRGHRKLRRVLQWRLAARLCRRYAQLHRLQPHRCASHRDLP